MVLTPSRKQRRRREAGSEGSPRRNPAPRNTNRVQGVSTGVSWQGTAKPDTTKEGWMRKRGGGRVKVVCSYPGRSVRGHLRG